MGYPTTIGYHKLFYKLRGKLLHMMCVEHQSKRIFTETLHGFIHNNALPGFGKDTLQAFAILANEEKIIEDLENVLEEKRKELFYFDLEYIESVVTYPTYFLAPEGKKRVLLDDASEKRAQERLEDFLSQNNFCIKEYYFNQDIRIENLINDKKTFINNPRTAKYMYTDTINFHHIMDDLYEYAYAYFRLNVAKVFIFSNQPMLNINYEPTSVFSERFFWFKTKHKPHRNIDDKEDFNEYIPRIKFPLSRYTIVSLTEQDILNNNFEKEITQIVKEGGSKNFFNSRRHICKENFKIFSNAQEDGRQNKLIREAYTFKLAILRAPRLISLHPAKEERLQNKIDKLDLKIEGKEITDKINKKNLKRRKLKRLLGETKYKGYIHMEIAVRPRGFTGTCKDVTRDEILDRDTTLFLEGFNVEIIFNPKNSWGHFNSWFMEDFADTIRLQSEVTMMDVMKWPYNMSITAEHILNMDSLILDRYTDQSFSSTAEHRYIKREVEKKEPQKRKKKF